MNAAAINLAIAKAFGTKNSILLPLPQQITVEQYCILTFIRTELMQYI